MLALVQQQEAEEQTAKPKKEAVLPPKPTFQ